VYVQFLIFICGEFFQWLVIICFFEDKHKNYSFVCLTKEIHFVFLLSLRVPARVSAMGENFHSLGEQARPRGERDNFLKDNRYPLSDESNYLGNIYYPFGWLSKYLG